MVQYLLWKTLLRCFGGVFAYFSKINDLDVTDFYKNLKLWYSTYLVDTHLEIRTFVITLNGMFILDLVIWYSIYNFTEL